MRADTFHVSRAKFLWRGRLPRAAPPELRRAGRRALALEFAADFADLFEVRGYAQRGAARRRAAESAGRPRSPSSTGPRRHARARACASIRGRRAVGRAAPSSSSRSRGPSGAPSACTVRASAEGSRQRARRFYAACGARSSMPRARAGACPSTPPTAVQRLLSRSRADLAMLLTETPAGPYPVRRRAVVQHGVRPRRHHHRAGDALVRSRHRARRAPLPGRAPGDDEDPERTPSRARSCTRCASGEMARSARCRSAATTAASTRRRSSSCSPAPTRAHRRSRRIEALWPNVERGARWIDALRRPRRRRLRRVRRATRAGLANQGWKDSEDSVFHADGSWPRAPIALCEVQAYVYAARRAAPRARRDLGGDAAPRSRAARRGRALRERFEGRSGARSSAPTRWRSTATSGPAGCGRSNAGHAASSPASRPGAGARRGQHAARAPTSFSGWGVRTLGRRGALQPDVLPQRLGLAARQRADRRRPRRATA